MKNLPCKGRGDYRTVYCYRCSVKSVCLLFKTLNRSRCPFGCRLVWAVIVHRISAHRSMHSICSQNFLPAPLGAPISAPVSDAQGAGFVSCKKRTGTLRIWRAREREPIWGSGGGAPSGVQGQSHWSGGQGGEAPWSWRHFTAEESKFVTLI